MAYVDSALLDLTEWSCRRFQVLTGRTNLWLAIQLTNLSIVVYFVWAAAYFWRGGVGTRIVLGVFCGAVLYALTQTIFKTSIEVYEKAAYLRIANGFRNPRRLQDALLRTSFLTLSAVLWYPVVFVYLNLNLWLILLTYLLVALTTVVLYLLACDPLPPCGSKIRDWLASLVSVRTRRFDVRTHVPDDSGSPGV